MRGTSYLGFTAKTPSTRSGLCQTRLCQLLPNLYAMRQTTCRNRSPYTGPAGHRYPSATFFLLPINRQRRDKFIARRVSNESPAPAGRHISAKVGANGANRIHATQMELELFVLARAMRRLQHCHPCINNDDASPFLSMPDQSGQFRHVFLPCAFPARAPDCLPKPKHRAHDNNQRVRPPEPPHAPFLASVSHDRQGDYQARVPPKPRCR